MISFQYEPLVLQFRHPFGISRWTRTETTSVIVRILHDGIEGVGEGSPNARYGETYDSASHFLSHLDLTGFDSPAEIPAIMAYVDALAPGEWSAKAALDAALHDWWAKSIGLPLYKAWGIAEQNRLITSFTIGIDTTEVMVRKTQEASPYGILKVKVGTDRDQETIAAIRSVTDKPIRVDANEGWKTKEEALERIEWLASEGVEFVEQPMPAAQLMEMPWLKVRSPLPLIADENCGRLHDVDSLQDAFHGINIKIDKSGGLLEGRKMALRARELGLSVMIGCMSSSSVAISAAAHLALMADYADLDGHLLVGNDPYEGIQVEEGRLLLPDWPGLGVRLRS
ncbi:MAG TPA: dipeptide epimerase [Rhodothermales bacterium]|nr:dipeptide epimerase [Bacteroidota bacterium]HRK73136.1 dipeptide epimerase [Rhodothermales bacterium]HRR09611.1 dipeptide epimerase [Rhodothermales bacterium]